MPFRLTVLTLFLSILPAAAQSQLDLLAFKPIASKYSKSLDRLIMVSTSPDQLHIFDPVTTTDLTIPLPKPPLSLDVSPDGNFAIVGHDALVTWVSLTSASVIKTIPVSGTANSVILGASYAWTFTSGATAINLNSGVVTSSFATGGSGVLNASGTALYVTYDNASPDDMQRLDVSAGTVGSSKYWPYHGDYPDCGPYWLSADGTRIYTGCSTVAHAASDPSVDMYYLSSIPVSSYPIVGLAESVARNRLAVISTSYPYATPLPTTPFDTQVQLFTNDYLNPAGTLALLPFVTPTGSFAAHGKAVFFSNDSSRLYIVAMADSSSNLTNNYAVEVLNLANPVACAPSFNTATASVDFSGSLGSVGITAAPDCIYTATSNANWIQLTSGAYGSGNNTVSWIARPNASATSRTGTISIGAQTFTITQGGAPSTTPVLLHLSFNVTDAVFGPPPIGQIVGISTNPNELHIFDPTTQTDRIVPLVMPPFAVSVSPDGLHASVGHDGWISYVDLSAATVTRIFPIVSDVHHVLLANNGYIYAFPQRAWSDIFSLAIASGNVTATSAIYQGRIPRLEPNGKYFYLGDNPWFSKWDITQGVAKSVSQPNLSICGNHWLYADGSELLSACGKTYAVSDILSQDLQYTGALSNAASLVWAANSGTLQSTAVIPTNFLPPGSVVTADQQIQFYGDAYLGYAGSVALPQYTSGGSSYPIHGQFLFWNPQSTKLFTIASVDSSAKLPSTNVVYTLDLTQPQPGCTFQLNGTIPMPPASGGFGSVSIVTGANCIWQATSSNTSWLTITAGNIGAGSATLSWLAASNPTAASRSATITVAGQTFTITQPGTLTQPPPGVDRIGVFRPSTGQFILDTNGNGTFDPGDSILNFGSNGDIPVVGNWGSGAKFSEIGVFRSSLTSSSFILNLESANQLTGTYNFATASADGKIRTPSFGGAGDIPVAGDWNGTGVITIGVFRNGQWILDQNNNGAWDGTSIDAVYNFGAAGDIPVVGDWNGDGRSKFGVFRPATGQFILDTQGHKSFDSTASIYNFGASGDIPVAYSPGQKHIGVFRPSTGQWILDTTGNGNWVPADQVFQFGAAGDYPIVGFWTIP